MRKIFVLGLYLLHILIPIIFVIIYKIKMRKYKTKEYSNGQECNKCKSKNVEIKKVYFFTNNRIRHISEKAFDLKTELPFVIWIMFGIPLLFLYMLKCWFGIILILWNYFLMILFPKKYKESKTCVICKDCNSVAVLK